MSDLFGNVLLPLFLPPAAALGWAALYRLIRLRYWLLPGWMTSAACVTVANLAGGYWLAAASGGLSFMVALAIWWWRRRKDRRRALRELGYKARALLAAVVRRAREAAQPRPVLRPVPGGAR